MNFVENFVSRFWRNFRWYRKRKGGTWYLVQIPAGSQTNGFQYWSQNSANTSWKELNLIVESYK